MYLNPGNDKIQTAMRSEFFVDKTMQIAEMNRMVDSDRRFASVTRARRFGKTVACDMLAAYYGRGCDSRRIFERTKLASVEGWDRYLNKFDVISFDMQGLFNLAKRQNVTNKEAISPYELLDKGVVADFHRQYPDEPFGGTTIFDVIQYLYEDLGRKTVVIIDEWDYVFRESQGPGAVDECWSFLNALFKDSAMSGMVALGYMTGIMPITRVSSQSFLNNFVDYSMLRPGVLAPYIGFTKQETQELCARVGFDLDELVRWYDGYKLGHTEILNTMSVVEALNRRECDCYWTGTSSFEAVRNYLMIDAEDLQSTMLELIGGKRVPVDTMFFDNSMDSLDSRDNVLVMLIHLGYLAYDADDRTCYVPNHEVSEVLRGALSKTGWQEVSQLVAKSRRLMEAIRECDAEAVAALIDEAHEDSASILKYNDENSLACALTMALFASRADYTMHRELPAGRGFADIVLYPRRPGRVPVIVELKFNRSAQTAIDQIRSRQYVRTLKGYSGPVAIVGINYDAATKRHTCLFETLEA